ncbi:MAG: hypothetical protein QOJ26_773 [Thermoplasmata archaeon]|nr:hypothetical protein [Thermoplasmata archaeon]
MMAPDVVGPARPRKAVAALLLLLGVFCFIGGAALAWGSNPLLGFSIGGVGTILLVIGSIMARNAMVGRFLEGDGE